MESSNLPESEQTNSAYRTAFLVQKQAQFLAFLERQLGNRAEAEDVLQTAYMKALTEVEMIRSDATVVAWFYRLLRNLLVDRHRQRAAAIRRQARLTHDIPAMTERDDEPHPPVCQCVLDLTQALKPSYREVLQRIVLDGEPLRQVADSLGITPNNTSVRLHRARHALHTALMRVCGSCAERGGLDCTCS